MRYRTLLVTVAAALLVAVSTPALAADMAVIVHRDNANALSKSTVEKIYKGEMTTWPGGGPIIVYDLPESSDVRADFTRALLGMTVSKLKATWTVKLFSGKATPPKTTGSDSEMKSVVAANKNAIGYISASSLDSSVKEALTIR